MSIFWPLGVQLSPLTCVLLITRWNREIKARSIGLICSFVAVCRSHCLLVYFWSRESPTPTKHEHGKDRRQEMIDNGLSNSFSTSVKRSISPKKTWCVRIIWFCNTIVFKKVCPNIVILRHEVFEKACPNIIIVRHEVFSSCPHITRLRTKISGHIP